METVKTFGELIELLENLKVKKNLIFRGQSDIKWKIVPKSGRQEYQKAQSERFNDYHAFRAWKRYAKFHLEKYPENNWDWLAIAQHHGLATRLLDWSKNPLVGTFFACNEKNKSDGALYYYEISNISESEIEDIDPFEYEGFTIFFPSGFASRIINQRGIFTIYDNPNTDLKTYLGKNLKIIKIKSSAKKDILHSLDFYGINELSLYQDLDSLSNYLNDYQLKFKQKVSSPDLDLLLPDE